MHELCAFSARSRYSNRTVTLIELSARLKVTRSARLKSPNGEFSYVKSNPVENSAGLKSSNAGFR